MRKLQKLRHQFSDANKRLYRARRLYRRLVRKWIEEPGIGDPDERDRRLNLCCARMMDGGILAHKPPYLKTDLSRYKNARYGMLSQWSKDDQRAEERTRDTHYWYHWTSKNGWITYYWQTVRPVKQERRGA